MNTKATILIKSIDAHCDAQGVQKKSKDGKPIWSGEMDVKDKPWIFYFAGDTKLEAGKKYYSELAWIKDLNAFRIVSAAEPKPKGKGWGGKTYSPDQAIATLVGIAYQHNKKIEEVVQDFKKAKGML